MELMKIVVGEGESVEAQLGSFSEGDKVEVIGGKLTGIKGVLIEQQGKRQMVVEISSIGYSLKMNVDISLLRKIRK